MINECFRVNWRHSSTTVMGCALCLWVRTWQWATAVRNTKVQTFRNPGARVSRIRASRVCFVMIINGFPFSSGCPVKRLASPRQALTFTVLHNWRRQLSGKRTAVESTIYNFSYNLTKVSICSEWKNPSRWWIQGWRLYRAGCIFIVRVFFLLLFF